MSDSTYSVPLAGPVVDTDEYEGDLGVAVGPGLGPIPVPPGIPPIEPALPLSPVKKPFPPFPPFCFVDLPDGCYRLSFTPNFALGSYEGTLRVDRAEGKLVVSGDLYFRPAVIGPIERLEQLERLTRQPIPMWPVPWPKYGIPIYPRRDYHSYLKATSVQLLSFGSQPCRASITFEQYDYTHPPAGTFNGSFPAAPGSRTVTIRFSKKPAPSFQWPGNYYEGEWVQGGVPRGSVVLGWVSPSFRRCTIEVDTLVDAVAPQSVAAASGAGTESFQTMMASAGWQATVVYDQTAIPKPAGVPNHKDCWTDGQLHNLMQAIRKPGTNLDTEWRMHVLVVPGKMSCSRGKMYDSIDVPREGVVSYSDDGYPSSHSSFFGTAQGKRQRDVPRAYLRSASHEVVHGFNQIHQEQEGGADNSIMTTTPSVADVLATATTGDPGVFPDDIKLAVNTQVRHHLVHFPDPVVRPGGHTFASWAITAVPQADRWEVTPELLRLDLDVASAEIHLGEPLQLSWTLTNTSDQDAAVPSDVSAEATYARITVVDAAGRRRAVTPFVVVCEHTHIASLAPGDSLASNSRVYWSNNGFAFERPGRYTVEISIDWTVGGVPLSVRGELPVYVNYPTADTDNAAAANLLHPQVGKWVALGGGADHLTEAVDRLNATVAMAGFAAGEADAAASTVKALRGYAGILPSSSGSADAADRPRRAAKATKRAAPAKRTAKKATPAKKARKRQ